MSKNKRRPWKDPQCHQEWLDTMLEGAVRVMSPSPLSEVDDECWEVRLTAAVATDTNRYGSINLHGVRVSEHAFVYALRVGPLIPGRVVMHLCHNYRCRRATVRW